jgi:hypothetical protein
LDYSDTF